MPIPPWPVRQANLQHSTSSKGDDSTPQSHKPPDANVLTFTKVSQSAAFAKQSHTRWTQATSDRMFQVARPAPSNQSAVASPRCKRDSHPPQDRHTLTTSIWMQYVA
eukprot:6184326-Pleurochrysis_carterae.AAC.1